MWICWVISGPWTINLLPIFVWICIFPTCLLKWKLYRICLILFHNKMTTRLWNSSALNFNLTFFFSYLLEFFRIMKLPVRILCFLFPYPSKPSLRDIWLNRHEFKIWLWIILVKLYLLAPNLIRILHFVCFWMFWTTPSWSYSWFLWCYRLLSLLHVGRHWSNTIWPIHWLHWHRTYWSIHRVNLLFVNILFRYPWCLNFYISLQFLMLNPQAPFQVLSITANLTLHF